MVTLMKYIYNLASREGHVETSADNVACKSLCAPVAPLGN